MRKKPDSKLSVKKLAKEKKEIKQEIVLPVVKPVVANSFLTYLTQEQKYLVISDIKRVQAFVTKDNFQQKILSADALGNSTPLKDAKKFCVIGAEAVLDICVGAKHAISNASHRLFNKSVIIINDEGKPDEALANIHKVLAEALKNPFADKQYVAPEVV